MKQEFWHERWAKSEIGFHLDIINPFLKRHWHALGAGSNDTIFVPLCGKSSDLLWLAERVKQVIGVEVSQKAIEDFFSENKLTPTIQQGEHFIKYRFENITLLCGDFFQLTPTDIPDCHFVYDRASLIAFPPDMRKIYVTKLDDLFPGDSRRLLVSIEYPQHEMNGPPHSVPTDEVHHHFSQQYDIQCLESVDILDKAQRFKDKGVTQMHEHVFLLEKIVS
ncbi:MAG: thiopurine S-methyltransferase [Porticoccaceae bacterium]|nr:thiopurine S-methyltransferase [Porticoccaceae bacterium]